MVDMGKQEDWLSAIPSEYTKKCYRHGVKKFEEFYQQPIDTLIGKSPEETGHVIDRFYVWLQEKGHGQNTRRNVVNSAIQFLKFFGTEPKYKKSLGIYRTVATTRDHRTVISEIQEMAKTADLREQVLLEVFLMGLRIGDVALLEWSTFDVQGETPLPILIMTKKESVIARSFITTEFKAMLDKYLNTIDKSNKYLFQSKRSGHMTVHGIQKIFHGLMKRAGVVSHGLFRWHTGRKLFLRTCAELGISSWSAKLMVGKSIPSSDDTYIHDAELKNDFVKVSNILRLFLKNEPQTIDQIKGLENAVKQLENENMAFKTRIDLMQKDIQTLQKSMDGLYHVSQTYPQTLEHTLFNKKTKKMETWSETVNTPEEKEASLRKFEEKARKLAESESQ